MPRSLHRAQVSSWCMWLVLIPDDRVDQISDVAQWQCTIKNQTFVGTHFYKQILRHQTMYPHVRFVFTKREAVCQTIWNVLSE